METELTFRILLLVLFVGFIAHRGYYTRKLGRPEADTIKTRDEKSTPLLANLLSIPAFLGTVIYIFYPPWMAWAALPLPAGLRWAGVGLALLGFLLLQWAQVALGKNWSDTPRLLKEQVLVTNGPYRWVRHPIYTAFLMILSANLLISANWFIGLAWIVMTFLEVRSRIGSEEGMMLEQFGEAYRVYMQGTGRLLPRLTRPREVASSKWQVTCHLPPATCHRVENTQDVLATFRFTTKMSISFKHSNVPGLEAK